MTRQREPTLGELRKTFAAVVVARKEGLAALERARGRDSCPSKPGQCGPDDGKQSSPGDLIGQRVDVRADRTLVRIFTRGQLVKIHPRQAPGHRATDSDDLPSERTVYAMRDLDALRRLAAGHGPAVGAYADALLEHPLPWTKMRQVYALLGLVKKWGPDRVNTACANALDHEAVNVGLIGRMLERATETTRTETPPAATVLTARFARDPGEFATRTATGTKGGQR